MSGGIVSTIFTPDPTCVPASNIWLSTAKCNKTPYGGYPDATCTYAFHGEAKKSSGRSDNCYATYTTTPDTVVYTGCPESYTHAASKYYFIGEGFYLEDNFCCPTAYPYEVDFKPFTTDFHGQLAPATIISQPLCKATSVEVLKSQIITVTLARDPEILTTTTQWAEDAILFAEAATVVAHVYSGPGTWSTCWGAACPRSFEPSPTFPSSITPTKTLQYTPPPECADPDNLWIVTTSCFLTSPTRAVQQNSRPDWLTCAATMVGPPGYSMASLCSVPASTIQESETLYYAGCPSGYTAVATSSGPGYDTSRYNIGWFDITAQNTQCCPSAYSMTTGPFSEGQSTSTVHDQMTYGLFVYPLPRCYAASVKGLSGKEVPMHTTSDGMAWDKRQEDGAWPTTVSWDYEHGTVWAHAQGAGYTVFMGTHTCYESCSTWLTYYYPDFTGGSTPATLTSTQTNDMPTDVISNSNPALGTTTLETSSNTGTTPIETNSGATQRFESMWPVMILASALLVLTLC